MKNVKKINECRVCGNENLVEVLNLGQQALTGVFPSDCSQNITKGPLALVKCTGLEDCCGLLQLSYSYDLDEMYGNNYGYRSGLNPTMVSHLYAKVSRIMKIVNLKSSSIVLDIGSNDGTTLSAYPTDSCIKVGIDPTSEKFRDFYPRNSIIIPDFFSADKFELQFPDKKAKVITSFSMFYDLEKPMDFVKDISRILDPEGIWVFEQSYMPLMLSRNSYDTVCHEHLEYYGLKQIKWMLDRCGLKIIDLEFNDINGGSFSVTAAHFKSDFKECTNVNEVLNEESLKKLDELSPYIEFSERVQKSRVELIRFVNDCVSVGEKVSFIGASTKGNVILQYCGFDGKYVGPVGEINPDKFGKYTPGTLIPIVNEEQLLLNEPDYIVVLPWHFRDYIISRYKFKKAKLVFPLPQLEIINPQN